VHKLFYAGQWAVSSPTPVFQNKTLESSRKRYRSIIANHKRTTQTFLCCAMGGVATNAHVPE
jgi:hypothetical protein